MSTPAKAAALAGYRGAQQYYGVVPDLIAYGKAIGGGCPIGAFCGREDVMSLLCEDVVAQKLVTEHPDANTLA